MSVEASPIARVPWEQRKVGSGNASQGGWAPLCMEQSCSEEHGYPCGLLTKQQLKNVWGTL